MRRALVCTLAVPALILAGCSGTGSPTTEPPTTPASAPDSTGASAAEEPAATTEAAPAENGAVDDDSATSAPGPDAASSTLRPSGEVEGGAEGQAAADVAKAFYVAMVDPGSHADVCDYLLSFSDTEKPMKEHRSDYETCQELLPEVLGQQVAPEGDEELAGIISAMQIRGADVQGDTAVVDGDNYSELFAQTIGQAPITLRKVSDEWYIDLDHSFQTTG